MGKPLLRTNLILELDEDKMPELRKNQGYVQLSNSQAWDNHTSANSCPLRTLREGITMFKEANYIEPNRIEIPVDAVRLLTQHQSYLDMVRFCGVVPQKSILDMLATLIHFPQGKIHTTYDSPLIRILGEGPPFTRGEVTISGWNSASKR